jgi:tRNA(Ser,Leu) C12 N-acetylase TAN1
MFKHIDDLDDKQRETLRSEITLLSVLIESNAQKLIPITHTCAGNAIDITSLTRSIIAANREKLEGKKLAIVPECRNNVQLSTKKIIDAVADALRDENELFDKKLTIDLKNPDYVMICNVFKSVAGFSLLPEYHGRFKKYNIVSYIDSLKLDDGSN